MKEEQELELLKGISAMGNNFNQLVKLAHTVGLIPLENEVRNHSIKGVLTMAKNWKQFEHILSLQGVEINYKYKGQTSRWIELLAIPNSIHYCKLMFILQRSLPMYLLLQNSKTEATHFYE